MNPAGIDTSTLLTMLGLIAAVWSIVPSTARLSFRLSLSWLDWLVIWAVLLIIHGLFFQPVLTALGFPTFGPWLWGFDKSATQYLLFLLLATFVYLHILKECFDEQDHVLRAHLRRFKADLDAALEAAL